MGAALGGAAHVREALDGCPLAREPLDRGLHANGSDELVHDEGAADGDKAFDAEELPAQAVGMLAGLPLMPR